MKKLPLPPRRENGSVTLTVLFAIAFVALCIGTYMGDIDGAHCTWADGKAILQTIEEHLL
jgi:hypothetical protein